MLKRTTSRKPVSWPDVPPWNVPGYVPESIDTEALAVALEVSGTDDPTGRYKGGPGRFEGESVACVYFHELMMNGAGDETFFLDDEAIEVFNLRPEERVFFDFPEDCERVFLYISDQGFAYLLTELEGYGEMEGEE